MLIDDGIVITIIEMIDPEARKAKPDRFDAIKIKS